jgi:periplasmic protein TonB
MKSASPLAATATVLLHAALAATVGLGLSLNQPQVKPPTLVEVKLLPTQPSAPLSAQPQTPLSLPIAPPTASLEPQKKRHQPKLRAEPKPVLQKQEVAPAQIKVPDASFEEKSAAFGTAAASSSTVAAPATPAKTNVSDAAYAATNRKPPYPRLSRSNEEQGTVLLRVLVRADGSAGAVDIKNSSGYPLLDESAKSTVQTWRFKPATVDGKPIAEWYQIAIPFTLQNN